MSMEKTRYTVEETHKLHRFRIDIALLFVAEVLWTIGVNMYQNLLPVYMNGIVQSPQLVSFIQSVGNFSGILALTSGWMSKKINMKWLLVMCWAVTIPAPLLYALANGPALFIIGQLSYSLTTMFAPAVVLYIFDYDCPGDKQPTYLLYCLVSQAASVAGPAIGGLVAKALDMRVMLLISFALFILSTLSTCFMSRAKARMPETAEQKAKKEPFSLKIHISEYGTVYIWMFFLMVISSIPYISRPLTSVYLSELCGVTTEQIGFGFTGACLGGMLITYVVRKMGKRWSVVAVTLGLPLLYAASVTGLLTGRSSLIIIMAALFLYGSNNSITFYHQGSFADIATGPHKEMFVAAYFAVRSVFITLANNIGGVVYEHSPANIFTTELIILTIWYVGFLVFVRIDQKRRKKIAIPPEKSA